MSVENNVDIEAAREESPAGLKKYPIAEMFLSPQGEGLFTGKMMQFIRLAGCCVGRPVATGTEEAATQSGRSRIFFMPQTSAPLLHDIHGEPTGNRAWLCHTYDGRPFWCDTDFVARHAMSVDEIVHLIRRDVDEVCLTGGEPLMFDLRSLVEALWGANETMRVHVETSGTIAFPDWLTAPVMREAHVWITVSPKQNVLQSCLEQANEIKLLVDENFSLSTAQTLVKGLKAFVFLQPVNAEKEVDQVNLRHCLDIQREMPDWHISTQMHKVWNVR